MKLLKNNGSTFNKESTTNFFNFKKLEIEDGTKIIKKSLILDSKGPFMMKKNTPYYRYINFFILNVVLVSAQKYWLFWVSVWRVVHYFDLVYIYM